MKTSISLELARRIALNAQLLDGRAKLPKGKEGIAQVIERLGYVQIDTTAVIKRSHHHTLWTRQPDYEEDMIDELQAKERWLFEYWAHAMSYLPMSDYRYYLPRMRNFENPRTKWGQYILGRGGGTAQAVLERIREEGPLSARDFEDTREKKGTWWDWKPAKAALELLFWKGELMIAERRKFQKYYDLTERVLPDNIETSFPESDELGRFFVRRALSAYGVAQEREVCNFMQPESDRDFDLRAASREVVSRSLTDLMNAGEVVSVQIEEEPSAEYYALSATVENTGDLERQAESIYLLSPFDNFIIQRERTKRLFDFDYVHEGYVPAAKRKYGYFVLPILWGDEFVGRLDPKADRKQKSLIIHNLVFEPHFGAFDEILPVLADKLADLTRFNGCETLTFEKISPARIKTSLEQEVFQREQGV